MVKAGQSNATAYAFMNKISWPTVNSIYVSICEYDVNSTSLKESENHH